jgi:serine/threonine-protein kinase
MNLSNDSLLGKKIDEYQIDVPLGVGGMARVYRALDTKLQRYVALKVIAPELRMDVEHTLRFEREAQSIARLEHPNIVHVYRFGENAGLYYIAMQYIEGADVGRLIEDYRRNGEFMPIDDIANIIDEIGKALDYAHSKGVIHRDVKPNNIIVNQQGQAILTDFGLVLLSDAGTQGEIFGSPSYIAPEQAISSANVVPQSDIYALGVTLFEMLTGELPFAGSDPMEIAMRHVSEPPPAPSQFNKTIPAAVDQVVLRSLAKEPGERYQTGQEFSADFQNAVVSWKMEHWQPSVTAIPDHLPEFGAASHLPELPPSPANINADERQPAPATPPIAVPQTLPASTRPVERQTLSSRLANTASSIGVRGWLIPVMVAAIMFGVGIIAMIIVFFATHPNNAQSLLAIPTSTLTITATVLPPTPTLQPTNTTQPLPTPTAVLLATRSPLSPSLPPPQDRNNAPAGSYRLGEFAVESYCNDRGYGIVLTNNQADWACTERSNNAVIYTLVASDFDIICRARYSSPTAFAIRDLHKDIAAYNWSCYDYLPASNNNAAVPPTSAAATPSIKTFHPFFQKDWIALVNVSDVPLSLQGVEFRTEGHTISAQVWGQSLLAPNACLRLDKTDKPPKDLPPNCSTVFDYSPDKSERDVWFGQKVMIVINPSTSYCYPAEKCDKP